jgi:hypothetical protein
VKVEPESVDEREHVRNRLEAPPHRSENRASLEMRHSRDAAAKILAQPTSARRSEGMLAMHQ